VPRLRGGSLVASETTNPGSEAALLESMQKGLKRAVSDPFTYKDCRSAINAAAGTYEIKNQYRYEQIKKIVVLLMAGKTIDDFQSFPKVLQAINETDLADIARRFLNMDKAVVVKMHGQAN
jgi:predicted Zn-dependent peptidase